MRLDRIDLEDLEKPLSKKGAVLMRLGDLQGNEAG
jgi:hypothetical protein